MRGGDRRTDLGDVAVVLHSREQFTHGLKCVYLDIALDGEILYDPQGVAVRRLAAVRELIRNEGLYRERTPAGDVWRWRRPPVPWGVWRERVRITDNARYRLGLAEMYRGEAREDANLHRWRSCVDDSQLATENAAKSVQGLVGPIGRTHDPGVLLQGELAEKRFPHAFEERVQRLSECAQLLGSQTHIYVAYGDEEERRTPWDMFGEEQARDALRLAEEAVGLTRELVAATGP